MEIRSTGNIRKLSAIVAIFSSGGKRWDAFRKREIIVKGNLKMKTLWIEGY